MTSLTSIRDHDKEKNNMPNILKPQEIRRVFIQLFVLSYILFLFSGCENILSVKETSSDNHGSDFDSTAYYDSIAVADSIAKILKSGIWEGNFGNKNYMTFILKDNALISRVDLVYELNNGDFKKVKMSSTSVGPFEVNSLCKLEFERNVAVGDTSYLVQFMVEINFKEKGMGIGFVEIIEDGIPHRDEASFEWKNDIPVNGPIRDGHWSGSISSPIYFGFNFDSKDGVSSNGSFVVLASNQMSFGTDSFGDSLFIGSSISSIYSNYGTYGSSTWGKLEVTLDEYMKGQGTLWIKLSSGDTTVPIEVNWSPSLPD